MKDIIRDAELSLLGIKACGLFLFFLGGSYLLLIQKLERFLLPCWRNQFLTSGILATFNAGIILSFGKIITCLWVVGKITLWKVGHWVGFLCLFITFSATLFFGIAGSFFNLEVEGKI